LICFSDARLLLQNAARCSLDVSKSFANATYTFIPASPSRFSTNLSALWRARSRVSA
jgi:hypothetical protein